MVLTPQEKPPAEPASYEAAVTELEQLVAAMEGGQMPLDRLLESYRRGAVLLARGRIGARRQCRQHDKNQITRHASLA